MKEMVASYVTRSEINPQRLMAIVTSPEGREAKIFVEPNQFKPANDESPISIWISVHPSANDSSDSEYEAACLEEEVLDDRLAVIALDVAERLGASEEGILEALREGLSLVGGREITTAEISAALEGTRESFPEVEAALEEGYAAKAFELNEKTNQYMLF